MKMLRYGGARECVGEKTDVTRLGALEALAAFLDTDKMTACLQAQVRISRLVDARSVLFWRDGDGDGDFVHFEGNAEVVADLRQMFVLLNDEEELREALRQRLCSQSLPDRLWASTASSAKRQASYRAIVLMFLTGVNNPHVYTNTQNTGDVRKAA
jgi:hypothetical protein